MSLKWFKLKSQWIKPFKTLQSSIRQWNLCLVVLVSPLSCARDLFAEGCLDLSRMGFAVLIWRALVQSRVLQTVLRLLIWGTSLVAFKVQNKVINKISTFYQDKHSYFQPVPPPLPTRPCTPNLVRAAWPTIKRCLLSFLLFFFFFFLNFRNNFLLIIIPRWWFSISRFISFCFPFVASFGDLQHKVLRF